MFVLAAALVLLQAGAVAGQAPADPTVEVGAAPDVEQTVPAPAAEEAPAAQPARPAPAREAPPRLRLDEPRESTWYGWQTLAIDLLSVGLIVGGAHYDAGVGVAIGLLGLHLGTPAAHWIHGVSEAGQISLAVRVLLAVVVTFAAIACLGDVLGGDGDDSDGSAGCTIAAVALIGYPVMTVVDAAVLAYEPSRPRSSATLQPWIDPRAHAVGLAYRGSL